MAGPRGPQMGPLHCILFLVPLLLSGVPGTGPATTHGPSSEGTSLLSQGITRPIASTSPESRLTEPTATPGLPFSLIPSTKHSSPADHVTSPSEAPPISTTAAGITAIGTTATSKYSSASSAATETSIEISPAAPGGLMTGNERANGFSMEALVPSASTVVSTDAGLEVPPVTEEVDYPNASVDSILELHNRSEAGSNGTFFENNVTSHWISTSASPMDDVGNGTTSTALSSPQFGLGVGSTTVVPRVEMITNATSSTTMSPAPTSEAPRGVSMALPPGEGNVAWPVKREAVVEGELVLGGLMMVHERGSGGKEGEKGWWCGPVMPQGGVQAVEAMLYTLDVLRGVPHPQLPGAGSLDVEGFLPGVSLGAHILDDCDSDTYGLEMAVDFIKGSISNIDGGAASDYSCSNRSSSVRKVISGVVGAASSVTSIQVANLLRLFKIPQVSFFSTSPELSNKQRFEYFSRTIPSDHYQVKAMVEIVRRMNWSYVSILYEESNYGIKAFEELEDLLTRHGICIAVKEKLVKDSGVAEEAAYDSIVLKLLTKPRAKGAIIFGSDQEVAGVMRAVRRCNATGSFWWIGSDGWSARTLVSDNNEPEVEGTLSVQPRAHPVQGFEEYFLSLTVDNNKRNPWFVEFWEDHFRCRYPGSPLTPFNRHYTKECSSRERLTRQNTAFEGQLQFVSDAVMAFAHAFRDMHRDLCHGLPGLCDAMNPVKGTELLKYLRKVEFFGLSGDKFRFDPQGDGPARYNIIHFKQLSPGRYKWVRVGEYTDGELKLNMSEVQFRLNRPQPPESVCSFPCELGQAKKYVEGEICCWHCFNCTQYQVRHPTDETRCVPCPLGTVPDAAHVSCLPIPEVYLRPDSGWAIGAMALASSGILLTLFVATVFIKNRSTPVVRATGRELTSVLLVGLLMCYGMTFALALKPTDAVCGLQRFGAGFSFTLVYAALLTKTNRIARIFAAGRRTARRPACISPRSQLLICAALTSVQLLVSGVWFIVSPPRAIHHHPTRESNLLVCASHTDASFALAFGYPILLLIVTTVYAFLTRRIPEAFNESRQLGATMYATCVVWLAFVPTYFGTAAHVPLRVASVAVAFSLSASVAVACLFAPKVYIVLIRPELNVRQSRIGAMSSSSAAAAAAATAAAAAAAAAGSGTTTAAAVAVAGTRGTGGRPADAVRRGSNAHHGPSSQAVDSGTQSDGIDLRELREKVPCAAGGTKGKVVDFDDGTVVSRGTQTAISGCVVAVAINNNNSNSVGNGPMVTGDVPL